jgi:hypothetical protein
MSDNGGKKSSKDKAHHNWWHKAKNFLIHDAGMYDVGDNANLKLSENKINARTVMVVDRLTICASHVDREANSVYDNSGDAFH